MYLVKSLSLESNVDPWCSSGADSRFPGSTAASAPTSSRDSVHFSKQMNRYLGPDSYSHRATLATSLWFLFLLLASFFFSHRLGKEFWSRPLKYPHISTKDSSFVWSLFAF